MPLNIHGQLTLADGSPAANAEIFFTALLPSKDKGENIPGFTSKTTCDENGNYNIDLNFGLYRVSTKLNTPSPINHGIVNLDESTTAENLEQVISIVSDAGGILGQFSIYVKMAEDAAKRAEGSAKQAETSANNAADSASSAAASAKTASDSAATASDSATAAAQSESNAADSATAAAQSESNAADSATAAAQSESNAADSATAAAQSESNAADSATAAAQSESNAADSATAAAQSETNASDSATLAKEWTVGPSGSPDTPADDNNAKYYKDESQKLYDKMMDAIMGVFQEQGVFKPEAAKEYPDAPDSPSLWFLTPVGDDGYEYTTGNLKGKTCYYGDWLLYFKSTDTFEIGPFSPLRKDIGDATEDAAGISKLSNQAESEDAANNKSVITPEKLHHNISQITASSIGALPDDQYAQADKMGGLKARLDESTATLYLSFDGSDV